MSRHTLTPRTDLANPVAVTCGWDGPLQTFFLQVDALEPADSDDAMLLWLGTDWREVTAPAAILTAAALWAVLPPDLADNLTAERDADRRPGPSPLLAAWRGQRR